MRGSKKHNVVSFRMGPASVGVLLLVGLGASVLSCDQIERHQMLTFFFDGVPPLGSPNFEEELVNSNSGEPAPGGQEPVWYVHEPQKDCGNCHQKQRTGRLSAQTRLLAPVPKLCHNCHPDFTASALFVHGPVAVGQCLFCHNPHRSKIKHLLNGPEPKLCYRCHDASMVELIPAHLTQQTSACTDCHNPHAGSIKALLKGAFSQTPGASTDGRTSGAMVQDNAAPVKERSADATRGPSETVDKTALDRKNLFEVFWQVSRLIKQGDLNKAKAQLEAIKDNKALTPEEQEKILNVLKLMDGASTEGKPNETATKSGKSSDSMSKQEREVADLYYRSMAFYRDGQLARAREGFVEVLRSGLIPDPMAETIRRYVADIDHTLAGGKPPPAQGP